MNGLSYISKPAGLRFVRFFASPALSAFLPDTLCPLFAQSYLTRFVRFLPHPLCPLFCLTRFGRFFASPALAAFCNV